MGVARTGIGMFGLGAFLFAIAGLPACGGKTTSEATYVEPAAPPSVNEASQVPFRTYPFVNLAKRKRVEVIVRLGVDQKPFDHDLMGTGKGIVTGTGTLALGTGAALLSPMAGGAMVGGIIILPMTVYAGIQNDVYAASIRKAFSDIDLPARIQQGMSVELAAPEPSTNRQQSSEYQLEITVGRYGLIGACFDFDGTLAVRSDGEILHQDQIIWGVGRRNRDLPPVHCADFGAFAEDDARLMRKTLLEASEIVTRAILNRLGVPS